MPIRTALALLLLLPAAAPAQELDLALNAVVKISGARDGMPVRGSGFVVGLEPGKATIVTASHVIEGLQRIEVIFAAEPTESFIAGAVLGMQPRNDHGLAVFQVRDSLPAGVSVLSFDTQARLERGEELFLLGFRQSSFAGISLSARFAGPDGNLLQLDRGVDPGLSGGPVVRQGAVVGVIAMTFLSSCYQGDKVTR